MSENMEKKTNNIRFAVGFLAFGLLWSTGLYVVATVLRIQKVKEPLRVPISVSGG